jgi:predicted PurR-regulated permease PerM
MSPSRLTALRALTVVLVGAAIVTLLPLWAPLVLAAWIADLLRPLVRRLEHLLGGKRRGAAALVVLLAVAVLIPLVFVGIAIAASIRDLLEQAHAALEGREKLAGVLVGAVPSARLTFDDWADIVSRYGSNAWQAASAVARASAKLLLGMFVFVFALYTFTASGDRAYAWLEQSMPLERRVLARFAAAFQETGRGLIIGAGGTALVQGAVATVAFAALGIPRAFVLGALTAACAPIPFVGTALVWVPVALELALTGELGRAIAVVVIGLAFISAIDNVLRPLLTRYGRLELPTFVVLLAIVGGVATFGPLGALLGPLVVRLATEALAVAREARAFGHETEAEPAPDAGA